MIVLLRHEVTLLKKGRLRFGTYEAGYYRSAVIPINCRAGLDGALALPPFHPFRSLCLHAICGGTSYFGRRTFLSPLFESGFTWGMLLSGTPGRTNRISTWFTNNQYGLHQLQFGLALTFGNDANREITLHDFTFP